MQYYLYYYNIIQYTHFQISVNNILFVAVLNS